MAGDEAVPILVRLPKKLRPEEAAAAKQSSERPFKKHKSGEHKKDKKRRDEKHGDKGHKSGERSHKDGEKSHKDGERSHKDGERSKKDKKRSREGDQAGEGPPKKKKRSKEKREKTGGGDAKPGSNGAGDDSGSKQVEGGGNRLDQSGRKQDAGGKALDRPSQNFDESAKKSDAKAKSLNASGQTDGVGQGEKGTPLKTSASKPKKLVDPTGKLETPGLKTKANPMGEGRLKSDGSRLSEEKQGQDSEQEEAPPSAAAMDDIIARLQKKDTYQIFAEPVDADVVLDYYDVIKDPMDFSTMKKRLKKGLYRTWDDFQAHVELMFDNAQKYNSPDTIFYKTAKSMQEASRKIIETARGALGTGQRKRQIASRFKDEPSTEPKKKTTAGWGGRRIKGQKLASIPGVDQLIQKGLSMDELAKLGMKQAGGKYGVGKGGDDAKQSWSDANDGEDVPGYRKTKEFWGPKDGRLPLASTEYKRSSYRARELPILGHGPKPSAPGGESHVLVPTGWHLPYAYARSLCRFAANLPEPVWAKVVAKVQKILPPGVKFGRGWVGEEEKPSGGQPKPPEPVVPLTATAAKTGPGSLSAAGAKPEALLRPGSAGAKSGTGASPASLSKTGPPAAVASPFTPASSIGPQQAMGISPVGGRTSLAIAPPEGEDHDAEDKPIGLVFGGPQRGASPTPYGRPPSASGFRPSSAGRKETAGLETGSRDGAGTVPETRMAEAGAKKESKAFERDGTEMATSAGAQPGGITSAGAQSEAVTSEGGQPGHATSAAGAPVKSQTAEEKRQPAVQDSAVAGSAPLEAPVHAFAKVDDVSSAGAASAGTEQAASVPEDGSKLSEKALDAEGRSGSDSVLPFLTPADFRGPAQGGGAAAAENLWRQRTGEAGTGVGETDFLRTEEAGPSSREEEERSREPVSFRDEGAETLSKEQMPIKRPEGGPERANIVPIGEGMQTPTEELPSARLSEPGPSSGVHGLEVPPEKQSGTSTGQHGLKFRPGKESEPSPEVHGLEVRSATESTPVPGESEEPPSVEGAPPVENQELIEDEKETAAGVFEDHQDGGARVGAPGAPSAGAEAKGESVGGLSENLRNGGPPEGALRGPRAKSDDEEGEVDGALAGERKEDRGLVARRGVSSEGLQEAGGLAGAETGTEQPVDTKKDADTEQLVETEKAVEWEIPAEPATPAKPETPAETENSAGLSEPARDAGARGGVRVAPADLRGGGELEAQEPDAPETVAAQGELTAAEGDAVVGARVGESETAEKASSEAERGPRTKTAPQETAALEEGGEGGSEEEPSEPSERHPSAADGPESAQTDAAMHQRDSPPVPEPNVPEAAPLVSETVTLTLPLPLTSDRDALLAEDVPSTPTGLPLGSPSFASRAKSPSPCLSPGSSRALSVERGVSVDPLAGFGSPLSVQSYSPGRLGAVYRGSSLAPAGRRTDSDGRERSSSIDTRDDMASHSGR